MAQLTYTISQRAAAGSCEIYCRFSAERGRVKRGRTGLYIRPERWNADDGCVLLPRFNSDELRTLRDLQHKLDDLENTIVQNYLAHPEQWNEQWLSVQIDKWRTGGVRSNSDSVLDFFSTQQAAHSKYMRSVMRSFRRFEVYRGKIVTFDDFTGALLHEFEGFLRNEWRLVQQYPKLLEIDNKSRTPQPRSDNAIATSFKRLRTLTKTAVGSHKLAVSPFASYTPPQEVYGTPYFLTIAERNALYKFDLSATPRLAVQRDIFVFQCFVGCRVGDFLALKKSNIVNGYLEYVAQKTERKRPEVLRIPLSPVAGEIIARYKSMPTDRLLPFISAQKYNKDIKTILSMAGITRLVTVRNPLTCCNEQLPICDVASSHMARRTFCGNLYKKVKDARLVGSMSGHVAGSKAFARYSTIDDEMKNEMLDMIQ